jgi:hypothetical protein
MAVDDREYWHRKIESINRQIDELVTTRDSIYRLLASSITHEIHDGDYEVIEESYEKLPVKWKGRDFT